MEISHGVEPATSLLTNELHHSVTAQTLAKAS